MFVELEKAHNNEPSKEENIADEIEENDFLDRLWSVGKKELETFCDHVKEAASIETFESECSKLQDCNAEIGTALEKLGLGKNALVFGLVSLIL